VKDKKLKQDKFFARIETRVTGRNRNEPLRWYAYPLALVVLALAAPAVLIGSAVAAGLAVIAGVILGALALIAGALIVVGGFLYLLKKVFTIPGAIR